MPPLQKQYQTIPFVGGLNQKAEPRALQAPGLKVGLDLQMDDIGGVQTRFPMALTSTAILGGGTLSNVRKIVPNGDELLCFTQTGLYSWDVAGSVWVSKGTYLAPTIDEVPLLAQSTDQSNAECAVFGSVRFVAWNDASSNGITMAVVDSSTGAVIVAPFTFVASAGPPRMVALATRVLLFYIASSTTHVVAIDPTLLTSTAILASSSATVATSTSATAYMDACASPDGSKACVAVQAVPGTYVVATVTAGLTVTSVTKSRYADAIGVAISPDGLWCQIARGHTGSSVVQGDLLTFPALADSTINQALGATSPSATNSIALAFATTKVSSHYRCSVFWSISGGTTKTNWADDSGAIGTETYLKNWCSVGSRAFDYNGTVYVWLVFAQANSYAVGAAAGVYKVQNAFYLVDSAGTVHAKSGYNVASGADLRPGTVVSLGSGAYAWGASINRIISLASSSSQGYGARTPRLITVAFDDNRARRAVRLGRTLYIPGGQVLGYDAVQLAEVGFHVSPWRFILSATGSVGHAAAGQYAVKCTYRWDNAQGERERSTTTNVGTLSTSLNDEIDIDYIKTTDLTLKGQTPAVEVWRTEVNPTADSPFYLATSLDPTVTSNPNKYLANIWTGGVVTGATGVFTDQLSDAALAIKENNPENDGVLENLAPPPCTIIAASATRLFLAGIAGAPNQVWYSKQRGTDEIASFNDALTVDLPAIGGSITAVVVFNETVIVFKDSAVFALVGEGYDNTGGGQNYEARRISALVGALTAEGVAVTDDAVWFKSHQGWQFLDKGWNVVDVGLGVSSYNTETPLATTVLRDKKQIRCLSAQRMLVFDFTDGVKQWFEWTIADGVDACVWAGTFMYLSTSGPKAEQTTHVLTTHGIDLETAWMKFADLAGFVRILRLVIIGALQSACTVRLRLARDYNESTYFDDVSWTLTPVNAGDPLELEHGPSIQQCKAMKARITVTPATTGESVQLTGLGVEWGAKQGLNRDLAASQKA